jgi:hypothetical protein
VYSVGINIRPIPSTVLKAQFSYVQLPGALSLATGDSYMALTTQAAWAF